MFLVACFFLAFTVIQVNRAVALYPVKYGIAECLAPEIVQSAVVPNRVKVFAA